MKVNVPRGVLVSIADLLNPRESWHDDALCAQTDPRVFYPAKGDNESVVAAKMICALCPVRAECLEEALEQGERFGVWGGMSERERRKLKHRAVA